MRLEKEESHDQKRQTQFKNKWAAKVNMDFFKSK